MLVRNREKSTKRVPIDCSYCEHNQYLTMGYVLHEAALHINRVGMVHALVTVNQNRVLNVRTEHRNF